MSEQAVEETMAPAPLRPRPKREKYKTEAGFKKALARWREEKKARDAATSARTRMTPDELDVDLLGEGSPFGARFVQVLVNENDELREIFQQAAREGWFDPGNDRGRTLFQNKVLDSTWWRENSDDYRRAWALERTNIGQFNNLIDLAKDNITTLAAQVGARNLTQEEVDDIARRYVYGGWDSEAKRGELRRYLAERIMPQDFEGGAPRLLGSAGNIARELRIIAESNGLRFDDNYYLSAARSVISGLRTEDDWIADIQEQAASLFPVFANQIRAGASARDMASSYINLMANELELDPNSITLDDQYIRQALGGFSQDGAPQAMNLADFRTMIRKDPRWLNTSVANNEMAGTMTEVMRMFGLVG